MFPGAGACWRKSSAHAPAGRRRSAPAIAPCHLCAGAGSAGPAWPQGPARSGGPGRRARSPEAPRRAGPRPRTEPAGACRAGATAWPTPAAAPQAPAPRRPGAPRPPAAGAIPGPAPAPPPPAAAPESPPVPGAARSAAGPGRRARGAVWLALSHWKTEPWPNRSRSEAKGCSSSANSAPVSGNAPQRPAIRSTPVRLISARVSVYRSRRRTRPWRRARKANGDGGQSSGAPRGPGAHGTVQKHGQQQAGERDPRGAVLLSLTAACRCLSPSRR